MSAKITQWFRDNMKDFKRPLSASSIATALSCPRKFMFANKWRLFRRAKQYSPAASFGKILHRLLEVGSERIEEVHQEIVKQHEALLAQIREGEDLMGDLQREANELHGAYIKAVAVASIFWERFPPKEYMVTVEREKEYAGEIPAGHLANPYSVPLPVVGYVDWKVEDNRNKERWIRDAKTTSRSFQSMLVGFPHCIQCRFYRVLSNLCLPDEPDIRGFILDIIRVPTIRMCGKDEKQAAIEGCTPLDAYIKRVKDWYDEQDETMGSHAIIFNEPVWPQELVSEIRRVSHMWNAEALPENFNRDLTRSTCYAYEKECPYYVLCSSDPATWPSYMEQMFEIVPETPGRKEVKDELGKD